LEGPPIRILVASSHHYLDPRDPASAALRRLVAGLGRAGCRVEVLTGSTLLDAPEDEPARLLATLGHSPAVAPLDPPPGSPAPDWPHPPAHPKVAVDGVAVHLLRGPTTRPHQPDEAERHAFATVLGHWTVYDGQTPLMDFDGSGAVTARYLSVPGAIDELLARQTASGVAWYLDDREGSVRDLVSNSGSVIDHVDYGSFGGVTAESSPSSGDRFKYAGMELDGITGFYYDRARYFDPAAGRFIGEDPSGFLPGETNTFRFVGNTPTDKVDRSGKSSATVGLGGLGLGGLGLGGLGGSIWGGIQGAAGAIGGAIAGVGAAGVAGATAAVGGAVSIGYMLGQLENAWDDQAAADALGRKLDQQLAEILASGLCMAQTLEEAYGQDGAKVIEEAIEAKFGETAEIVGGVISATETQRGNPDPRCGPGVKIILQLQDEWNKLAGKISIGYNPSTTQAGIPKPSSRGGYGPR